MVAINSPSSLRTFWHGIHLCQGQGEAAAVTVVSAASSVAVKAGGAACRVDAGICAGWLP
jgi:hypothetical protein